MYRKQKSSLLARIEGQVFALRQADAVSRARCLQRVTWAFEALRNLPLDSSETRMCEQMERRIAALRDGAIEGQPEKLFIHRQTLARSDCLLWQLRLRNNRKDSDAELDLP